MLWSCIKQKIFHHNCLFYEIWKCKILSAISLMLIMKDWEPCYIVGAGIKCYQSLMYKATSTQQLLPWYSWIDMARPIQHAPPCNLHPESGWGVTWYGWIDTASQADTACTPMSPASRVWLGCDLIWLNRHGQPGRYSMHPHVTCTPKVAGVWPDMAEWMRAMHSNPRDWVLWGLTCRFIHPYQGNNLFITPLWYVIISRLLMNQFWSWF